MNEFVQFAVALLTIANPIGAVAIFSGLAGDRPEGEQKAMAHATGVAVAVILLLVTWLGSEMLNVFGVTTAGLQVAGGVIIALLGLSMLHSQTSSMAHKEEEGEEAKLKESIAVVPMAIPIVAGPGAITTVINATNQLSSVYDRLLISGICVIVSVILWVCLSFAAPISRRFGVTGINLVTRIMGMVLTALAFQMLAEGLKELLPGLA
jgi:multiple antibiotic resistance protein